ncbi:MAG: hypothetical protein ACTSPB_06425, partial [Candidatus Thorarchaeota archaeon]
IMRETSFEDFSVDSEIKAMKMVNQLPSKFQEGIEHWAVYFFDMMTKEFRREMHCKKIFAAELLFYKDRIPEVFHGIVDWNMVWKLKKVLVEENKRWVQYWKNRAGELDG